MEMGFRLGHGPRFICIDDPRKTSALMTRARQGVLTHKDKKKVGFCRRAKGLFGRITCTQESRSRTLLM